MCHSGASSERFPDGISPVELTAGVWLKGCLGGHVEMAVWRGVAAWKVTGVMWSRPRWR